MSTDTTVAEDLIANFRAAERLVNVIGAQRDAEERAYTRGWTECGEALSYIVAEAFEAGRADMLREVDAGWAEVAARARYLGSPESRTYDEKHLAELEACNPRPGDFLGIERDPGYIDRCRTSLEASAHNHHQRAA